MACLNIELLNKGNIDGLHKHFLRAGLPKKEILIAYISDFRKQNYQKKKFLIAYISIVESRITKNRIF